MSDSLFNNFDSVSSKQWRQKIQYDLKGADYNEALVWKSPDGFNVRPFYHSEEFEEAPKKSGSRSTKWQICQEIYVTSVTQANTKALNVLNRGAESILFILPTEAISVYHLLKNIKLSETTIYLKMEFLSEAFVQRLKNYLLHKKARVFMNVDLIGNLARSGNWFQDSKQDHEVLNNIYKPFEGIKGVLSVDMTLYQNAGATMIQQLAYALAHANEYLNHFGEAGIAGKLNFNVSVGTNYFFEIAKLQSLRKLYSLLASEYNLETDCNIFVTPTRRNKTIYDYNTNLLRTTTESMSAILGGANTICNLPYDSLYHKDNEFAERIARNQLLIMKNESYFAEVDNPTDGTYYIESLTDSLSEKTLELFKEIEKNGGFLKYLEEGTIQRKIKEYAKKEQKRFDEGEEILLGTNKHPNPNDMMKNDLELYPFVKTNKRKTIIEPIIPNRLSEKLEQQRLKNEN